ncbi:acyltransferase [Saccharophagus degradans]|uniref:acyltransferase family protein n=1 Tax=Saccharophagus degradans TaxID=86304 RepID=UPI001C0A1951|nr:acyltransferase [Saccharophagus degradans]MBU2985523.1 acyltransferase [Saccharophagus degradans]
MRFFLRPQASCQYLAPLDGVRAIAVMLVITFHAYFFLQYGMAEMSSFIEFSNSLPAALSWIRRGDLGVDLFFVLSAFLIGSQLFCENYQTDHICLKRFYLKRFLRIYPIYLFALGIHVASKGWDPALLGNIFAFNNLVNLEDIIIPWSWSLSVEIQFYAVFPLLILALTRTSQAVFFAAIVILFSLIWTSYFYFTNPVLQTQSVIDVIANKDKATQIFYMQYLYVSPAVRAPAFIFGAAAAWLWNNKRDACTAYYQRHKKLFLIGSFAAIAIIAVISSVNIYQPKATMSTVQNTLYTLNMLFGRTLFSLLAAGLLLVVLIPKQQVSFPSRLLSSKWLFPIARGSYSMYLFHPIFLFAAFALLFGEQKINQVSLTQLFALAGLGILFSFVFSIFTYYLIEKWFTFSRIARFIDSKKSTVDA